MNRSHLYLSHLIGMPWAMEPGAMRSYAAMLAAGYAAREGVAERAPAAAASSSRRSSSPPPASIALIQVHGAIVQRASQLGPCEGGTGTEEISAALSQAVADKSIGQILMEFDTPGGSVFGVGELGAQIMAARAQKPVIGIANSMAASAGYWLLSQCSEAYMTPGGLVGSIGVYAAHEDVSQALEKAGVNVTLVSAGRYKTEGNPFAPLDPDAQDNMQASVDGYYDQFVGAVAKGRGVPASTVRGGMGQGRVLQAKDALANRMVDGIATRSDLIRRMVSRPAGSGRSAGASAAMLAQAARAREIDLLEAGDTQPRRPSLAQLRNEIDLLA